jgi:hypothetical protein
MLSLILVWPAAIVGGIFTLLPASTKARNHSYWVFSVDSL